MSQQTISLLWYVYNNVRIPIIIIFLLSLSDEKPNGDNSAQDQEEQ